MELDDSSHNNAKRKSRDQFLESACEWLCFRTQPTLSFDVIRQLDSSRTYQAA
ncbi:hypothetical protein [Photobacterium leiognathi]|uniref:hypothetical protein n=1 Tax=Photobacterium leiognathi TaxID=553611 RepID=UPI00273A13D8|nr:hypothetical protein [Photobacterium leiognathi]